MPLTRRRTPSKSAHGRSLSNLLGRVRVIYHEPSEKSANCPWLAHSFVHSSSRRLPIDWPSRGEQHATASGERSCRLEDEEEEEEISCRRFLDHDEPTKNEEKRKKLHSIRSVGRLAYPNNNNNNNGRHRSLTSPSRLASAEEENQERASQLILDKCSAIEAQNQYRGQPNSGFLE